MTDPTSAGDWIGRELGARAVSWTDRDVILYHLALGARADELDLVFEQRLHVHPLFGLTLAQWAPDVLGGEGAFPVGQSVQGAQGLEVLAPMPPSGSTEITARVAAVWDKGSAAVFEVEASCDYFRGVWSIFAPGRGGFGGERGPSKRSAPTGPPAYASEIVLDPRAAALYRLTGDRHLIHVDPAAAQAIGYPKPILHGLATLGTAVMALADQVGAKPWELTSLTGRFSSVAFPGDRLAVESWADGTFRVVSGRGVAIDDGTIAFGGAR
ncbi:MAG: MaoC/PaaZ C-terminal domain-containing protein [Nocardioides sp.]|uniref:MaoC/PaaZ C-terminal domain-containing protein n=1 Tax=Nocardioides sp. TaxID=35761 RepID=UPI0039E4429B